MEKEVELRPCPFCGSSRIEFNHGYKCYRVDCGSAGPTYSDPEKALEKWNNAYCWKELASRDEIIKKLADYATHMNSCSWRNGLAGKPSNHCDCGLEETLSLIEKGE